MEHPFYEAYAGLLAAELLGLAALCDEHATFYVRRHGCREHTPDSAGWPSAGQHEPVRPRRASTSRLA